MNATAQAAAAAWWCNVKGARRSSDATEDTACTVTKRQSSTSRDTWASRCVEPAELISHSVDDQRARRRACWRTHPCSRWLPLPVAAALVWVSILLLLAGLSPHVCGETTATTTATAPSSSLDFDTMSWTQWGNLYDSLAAAMALERVYKSSPRVRAKLLVATQISMNQFLAGEAIVRQQLSEIAGTSVARVQLEFLQTSALRESDRGVYFAAFGISALPDPPVDRTVATTSSSDSIQTAIEQERARIIQRLQYGAIVREQNVTIASLTLFGTAMELVDVALDGELFYPIDLKPWIAARIAVLPAVYSNYSSSNYNFTSGSASATVSYSSGTTSTGGAQGLYAPSRDSYQSLRLRFLFAKALLPLQPGTSDILVREATSAPFDSYYSSSASVIEIEVHLNDESFRVAVDGYLRNGSLAQEFSSIEPQWTIGAIDVDPLSGLLYSPPRPDSSTSAVTPAPAGTLPVSSTIDVMFQLNNVSFAHVASRKWRILERVAQFLSLVGCSDCQVSFKDILILSDDATVAATHNDGDSSEAMTTIPSALDPINAFSTILSFRIDSLGSNISNFIGNLQTQVFSGPSPALCVSIGVQDENDTKLLSSSPAAAGFSTFVTCALASYQNVTQLPSQSTTLTTTEPFVQLNLTLGLTDKALNASGTTSQVAASLFDQHRVRCALLVLFQQVAIYDANVHLEATSEVFRVDSGGEPLLSLTYTVAIEDESQRQGIAALFLSKRLERTIAAYTSQRLFVFDRVADLHADGSPWLAAKLPGIALSSENSTAPALVRSDSNSTATSSSPPARVYRFQDPLEGSNPSVLAFSDPSLAPKCPPSGTTTSGSQQCLSIQFVSDFEDNALFLRAIESNAVVSSLSVVLPHESQVNTVPVVTTNVPAPWIYNDSSATATPWIFCANASSTTNPLLRFRFEFAAGYSSAAGQPIPITFSLDVRVEVENSQNDSNSGATKLSVRKSSFLPLASYNSGNASSAYGHSHFNPFVTALLASTNATANATAAAASNSTDTSSGNSTALGVAFRIHQSSIGGFFNRARIASQASSSSPACSACYAKLEACDASLECRALSSCFSAYADSDPALYTSLLRLSANASSPSSSSSSPPPVTHDASWLLEQCLGGRHEDNMWTYSVLLQFLNGLLCTSGAQCPVETSAAIAGTTTTLEAGDPRSSLVLRYTPMEQTLTFSSADFASTLEFLIATDEDADVGGSPTGVRSQVFSNLTWEDSSLSALREMLVGLYLGRQSSTNSVNSSAPSIKVFRGDDDAISNATGEVVRIQYFFLPTWTSYRGSDVSRSELLPYVQTVLGDSPLVKTPQGSERLELVALDS